MRAQLEIWTMTACLLLLIACSHTSAHQRISIPAEEPEAVPDPPVVEAVKERDELERRETPLRRKLDTIIIPSIEFRQASVEDVIQYLHEQSIMLDADSPPGERGVNIILNLRRPAVKAPDVSDPASHDETFDRSGPDAENLLTMNLRNITLWNALRHVTRIAGLKMRIDRNAVVISPGGKKQGDMITRIYKVSPGVFDEVLEEE